MKLTEKEENVLKKTIELWELFAELDVINNDDRKEVSYFIHEIQKTILYRPTIRYINDLNGKGSLNK